MPVMITTKRADATASGFDVEDFVKGCGQNDRNQETKQADAPIKLQGGADHPAQCIFVLARTVLGNIPDNGFADAQNPSDKGIRSNCIISAQMP